MDCSAMMAARYDLKPAKKVFLYRNGMTDSQPKCMVVNDRQVRDFSTFLNRATSGLRAPVAIRNIYTPAEGHRVKALGDLQSGRYYVAGGAETFKKVKYGSGTRLLARRQPKTELVLPPRALAHVVVASARYKRPIEKPFVIHVFRNGDERYRGARVLLPRKIMGSWEHVLELVTEKSNLFTPAKRLCTLDGRLLHAVSELQDGGKYVALEGRRAFQKVSYCATEEKKSPFRAAATVPRAIHRLKRRPHRPRGVKPAPEDGLDNSNKTPILTESLKLKNQERRKSRPFAGRKNKESRVKAVEDHRADSIFGGSPVPAVSPTTEPLATVEASPLHNAVKHQTPKTLDTPVEAPFEPVRASSPVTQAHPTVVEAVVEEEVTEELNLSVADDESRPIPHSVINDDTKDNVEDISGEAAMKAESPHNETGDVEEVLESGETEVEKPLELEEALEVTEEVDEGENFGTANKQAIKELESQPLQTSVDLSLQRNKPADMAESLALTDKDFEATTGSKKSSATSMRSKRSSRKTSGTKSRPVSVEQVSQSRTHSVLNVSRPESKAAEEISENKSPTPQVLETVNSDQEDTDIPDESGVDSEEVKTEPIVTPEQTNQAQGNDDIEAGTNEEAEVNTEPTQTVEEEQTDNSVDDKQADEIPEEVPEADPVDTGDQDQENTSEPDATFVIEDMPVETQS